MNVGLVTLGCTKNQVDSEMILGLFKKWNFTIVSDSNLADIIIVNTCGFIESAKKEAIETILEMAEYKKERCKHLIVTGCLAKRYKQDMIKNLPEVDLVIGNDEYDQIGNILTKYFKTTLMGDLAFKDRLLASNFPMAYIRVADGCDNRCSYCAIPMIRGNFHSRKMEDILSEVKDLACQGISEFNLIAQDTTKYGYDIYGEYKLQQLLHEMSKIEGVKWIRILYMYAYEITDELLEEMKTNSKVCLYFDIPIQHIHDTILKKMNRKDTKQIIYDRIKYIREQIPNAVIRTTVIVGFPGETEQQFHELLDSIKELKFDMLGAFTYSREEDTKAYDMDDQIEESIKKERLDDLLTVQQSISKTSLESKIGKEYEVLVEEISQDEKYFVCRAYMNAPDVDGKILIKIDETSAAKAIVGEYCNVKIIDCAEYDLYAKIAN